MADWTSGSFVPLAHRKVTEQEAIQQAVSDQQQPPTVSWPHVGDSEGYITSLVLFPHFFQQELLTHCSAHTPCHHRLLPETSAVPRWEICQTSMLPVLYSEHRNALACLASRSYLHPTTSRGCSAFGVRAP